MNNNNKQTFFLLVIILLALSLFSGVRSAEEQKPLVVVAAMSHYSHLSVILPTAGKMRERGYDVEVINAEKYKPLIESYGLTWNGGADPEMHYIPAAPVYDTLVGSDAENIRRTCAMVGLFMEKIDPISDGLRDTLIQIQEREGDREVFVLIDFILASHVGGGRVLNDLGMKYIIMHVSQPQPIHPVIPFWLSSATYGEMYSQGIYGVVKNFYNIASFMACVVWNNPSRGPPMQFPGVMQVTPFLPALSYPSNDPFTQYVGLINIESEAKLANATADWLNEQEKVVYVGAGSIFRFPEPVMRRMFSVLRGMGFSILFAKKEVEKVYPADLVTSWKSDDGILIANWVAQQALLKHPKVKLMMSHCGFGALRESIDAVKPLFCVPLMVDQIGTSSIVVERGIGDRILLASELLDVEDIERRVNNLLSTKVAKKIAGIKKMSALLGKENKAADLVEEALLFGGEHYQPAKLVNVAAYFRMVVLCIVLMSLAGAFYCGGRCLKKKARRENVNASTVTKTEKKHNDDVELDTVGGIKAFREVRGTCSS